MSSVTQRIKEIKQPRGGYIKPSQFNVTKIDDGHTLNVNENVSAPIVGLVVDYLTRFAMGTELSKVFEVSIKGAEIAENNFMELGAIGYSMELLSAIGDIDDKSIIAACRLSSLDSWYRNPMGAMKAKREYEIEPDKETIENIKIMVQRCVKFWDTYGPIIKDGFTFEPNGYTRTVSSGDGDYLTADTLWDFKVSKYKPTNKYTLQLLMYWIMGKHSGQKVYENITNLGIFNPRLNEVYLFDTNNISDEVIMEVERDIIGY